MPTTRPLSLPWRLLEAVFQHRYRIETLDNDPGSLFAYNLYPHQGAPLSLQCGAVIQPGDTLLEIHFRREALQAHATSPDPVRLGLTLIRLGDRDIPRLARALEREPHLRSVRALHALTLFHLGVQRYGFEVRPVEGRWGALWFTAWHRLLMARDHPAGQARVRRRGDALETRNVWISRKELLRRYPQPPANEESPPEKGK